MAKSELFGADEAGGLSEGWQYTLLLTRAREYHTNAMPRCQLDGLMRPGHSVKDIFERTNQTEGASSRSSVAAEAMWRIRPGIAWSESVSKLQTLQFYHDFVFSPTVLR